jgi:crossover junction endodeoxyribonuclease RuvC
MRRIADVPAMVCVEDVFIPHQAARVGQAINLAKLAAVARLALYERGIPFCVVTPQQLKKFVTGSGSGDKGIIIREVYKKWGVDCKDDNQADAAVLAHLAEAVWLKISGRSEFDKLLAYQRDVVEKVVKERPFYNVDAGKPEP